MLFYYSGGVMNDSRTHTVPLPVFMATNSLDVLPLTCPQYTKPDSPVFEID